MYLEIPNAKPLTINTLILDLNGTITIRGILIDGVAEKINAIKKLGIRIVLFSGDTRGTAAKIASDLEIELFKTQNAQDKRTHALSLDAKTCATIGNGLIDAELFESVALSIAVIQGEGLHIRALQGADIVCTSILDALDLLLDSNSLIATLRA